VFSFPLPFTQAETMPTRSIASNTFFATNAESRKWVYQTRVHAWLRVKVQIRRDVTADGVVRVEEVEDAMFNDEGES